MIERGLGVDSTSGVYNWRGPEHTVTVLRQEHTELRSPWFEQ